MINPDTVPEATAPTEHHADFLEFSALQSWNGNVSVRDYVRDLKLASSTEAIADSEGREEEPDPDDESEALAEAAFAELDERQRSCGGQAGQYPFRITGNTLQLKKNADQSLYTFLALLSWYGKDAGPKDTDGEKLFEEVCAKAAEAYLGGPGNRVRSYVFGFPRGLEPKGFAEALNRLCAELGEGQGHHKGREKLPDQKDGKLDIVAWVEFEDKRQGKLITFGQCATGRNWDEKVTELPPPDRWCGHWMAETPTVLPLRSFFVPHRIERHNWSRTCTFGGILYDRCRIAGLASKINSTLQKSWASWSAHALKRIRRAK
jgi:hypothetical protein